MTTYSVIIGSPPDGSTLPSGTFGSFGCSTKLSTPAEHGSQVGKGRKQVEIRMHEGEVLDVLHLSDIGPDANGQIGKLSLERVTKCLSTADDLVQVDDE
jgi:hypothetical protein